MQVVRLPSPEHDRNEARNNDSFKKKEGAEEESSKTKVAGPTVALLPQLLSPGSEWINAQQHSRWKISVLVKGRLKTCLDNDVGPKKV